MVRDATSLPSASNSGSLPPGCDRPRSKYRRCGSLGRSAAAGSSRRSLSRSSLTDNTDIYHVAEEPIRKAQIKERDGQGSAPLPTSPLRLLGTFGMNSKWWRQLCRLYIKFINLGQNAH